MEIVNLNNRFLYINNKAIGGCRNIFIRTLSMFSRINIFDRYYLEYTLAGSEEPKTIPISEYLINGDIVKVRSRYAIA